MSSVTFYVRIHAGETAHINGLPAGTTYTVEEQPAAGWTLIDSSGTVGQIASRRTSQAWFKNDKTREFGTATIVAFKTVDGSRPEDGTSYTFQLKDSSGKVIDTQKSADGGIVEFKTLKYEKNAAAGVDDIGTHVYTVSEVKGTDGTMSYDSHVETVTVKVTEATDKFNQKYLKTAVTTDASGVVFDNTHRPGSLVLRKAVQGTSGASASFTFEARLVDADGKPVTSISAAVLDAQGKGTPATRSASDGVYTFQITAAQSVRIDGLPRGTVYTVSEKALPAGYAYVSSHGTEGTIESNATKIAAVTNSYHAEGDVSFAVTKQVTGLEVSGWSFELLDSSGKVVSTAVSGSDGKVSFSPISYRKDSTADDTGTHVYTIREVKGTRTDVKYDAHVLTEKVEVSDDGAGHLVCKVTSSGSSTFVNTPLAVIPQTGSAGMLRTAAIGLAVAAASVAGYLAARRMRR
ncbi:MAG: FctA domain-containing protein [Atopobiaceae bacterium]|nr:FctA domain-containing protein [Atopobiaceae bacterium]